MKKFLSLIFAILICSTSVYANTKICKVANTDGEVAVNVSIEDVTNGTFIVTATNDTNRNVSISFTVTWGNDSRSNVILAKPEQTTTKTITLNKDKRHASAPRINISGTRCTN